MIRTVNNAAHLDEDARSLRLVAFVYSAIVLAAVAIGFYGLFSLISLAESALRVSASTL
jgi:hypothetical protein